MFKRIKAVLPLRFWVFILCAAVTAGAFVSSLVWGSGALVFLGAGLLTLRGVLDLQQSQHAITRNYPVIGHLRFLMEFIRPEIRQYFIESDREAAPFSRAQRSLVYQRAKGEPDDHPFGTHLDVGARGYEWINHSAQPTQLASADFRLWIGGVPGTDAASACTQPYEASIFNISAMSFGSLSANAIAALNKGAYMGGFAHDTGEGSISRHHRLHGGDLIWEIGSGYFGCRHEDGSFSDDKFMANARDPQVKMIELKMSQGAKPGHGGVLPAAGEARLFAALSAVLAMAPLALLTAAGTRTLLHGDELRLAAGARAGSREKAACAHEGRLRAGRARSRALTWCVHVRAGRADGGP
jgi:hypothetical protein